MTSHRAPLSLLAKLCLMLASVLGLNWGLALHVLPAVGQDDNPFGAAKAPAAKVAPAGKAKSNPADEPSLSSATPVEDHPVAAAVRQSAPKTLDQLTRAARISLQLNRPDDFKLYVAAWLKLTPTDADLAALSRKYGSALFLEMSRRKEFQPEGRQMADVVLDGTAKYARDPARLNAAIAQLAAADRQQRTAAFRVFREAGIDGIATLFHALADESLKADRPSVRSALVALGADSIGPATAALASPQVTVRADAAIVLGQLQNRSAIPFLLGLAVAEPGTADQVAATEALHALSEPLPPKARVANYYAKRIRADLAGEIVDEIDHEGKITLWRWDDTAQTVQQVRVEKLQAALLAADRFAKRLLPLASAEPEHARLALLVQLETAKTLNGIDQPLPQGDGTAYALALQHGIDTLDAALLDAMKLQRPIAAAAVAEVLGSSGRPEILSGSGGAERPLVEALGYPDRRLQVAALQAIVRLNPSDTFPGSSRVVETMQFLLTSSGRPRVLVAHPQSAEATRIGSLYGDLGFDADVVITGRALALQASKNADYELVLLSDHIDSPPVGEALQLLRKNPRSARLPVAIMEDDPADGGDTNVLETSAGTVIAKLRTPRTRSFVPNARTARARLAVGDDRFAVVSLPPESIPSLRFLHARIFQELEVYSVPAELRLEQAYFVLEAMGEMLSRTEPPKFYDFSRLEPEVESTLASPSLALLSTKVLGLMATPTAQLALVEQASLRSVPVEERQAAAVAFEQAVERRGLYLTQSQIQRQFNRYNQSATGDADTQAVLGQLLDSIERPSAAARAEKQSQFTSKLAVPVSQPVETGVPEETGVPGVVPAAMPEIDPIAEPTPESAE